MKRGQRVFIDIGDLHQGWAVLVQAVGSGRWLVQLDEGGTIVLQADMIRDR